MFKSDPDCSYDCSYRGLIALSQWLVSACNSAQDRRDACPALSDAAGDGFDLSHPRPHPAFHAVGQCGECAGRDLASQQIGRMRHGRAADVFGRRILRVEARGEIEAYLAEDVLDEGGAVEGFFAGEWVAAFAPFGMAQGDERADEFAQ